MKITYLLLTLVFVSACKKKEPSQKSTTQFDYLIGYWERTNEQEGKNTFEHWKAVGPDLLEGHGYTLEGKDTIFNERLRLYKKEDGWFLEVSGPNEQPTPFNVSSQQSNSFTAENPANEFPKKIRYSYFDDVLTAQVSADSVVMSFIFWRMEK